MIRSFRHKGLEAFFLRGSKAGIQPRHAAKLRVILSTLDAARRASDLNAPGWRLHVLQGQLQGFYAVTVSANWRIVFRFEADDVLDVDYLDYH